MCAARWHRKPATPSRLWLGRRPPRRTTWLPRRPRACRTPGRRRNPRPAVAWASVRRSARAVLTVDDETWTAPSGQRGEDAAVAECHGPYRVVVGQHGDDDVALAGVGHRGGRSSPGRPVRSPCRGAVVRGDLVTRFEQVGGHGRTHVAQADESDLLATHSYRVGSNCGGRRRSRRPSDQATLSDSASAGVSAISRIWSSSRAATCAASHSGHLVVIRQSGQERGDAPLADIGALIPQPPAAFSDLDQACPSVVGINRNRLHQSLLFQSLNKAAVMPDWLAPSASASAVTSSGPSRLRRTRTSVALALRPLRSARCRHIRSALETSMAEIASTLLSGVSLTTTFISFIGSNTAEPRRVGLACCGARVQGLTGGLPVAN